ncbi:MAG: hypothetical protein RL434_37 [Pseudomonadota bacterium]|jgi:methyl-accepting chemotaxis protein
MTVRLHHRIIGLAVLSATLAVAITVLIIRHHREEMGREILTEIELLTRDTLREEVLGVADLFETANGLIEQQVMRGLDIAQEQLSRAGGVRFGEEPLTWEVLDQTRQDAAQAEQVVLPEVLVGEEPLGQNRSFEVETPFIDEVARLAGGTVTLFQRMNREGSMLRVATNVRKLDGSRAIGTYIPHTMPDGTPNPVLKVVLAGQTYRGRAFVVNAWYVTAYAPVFDSAGDVVGMIYTGVPQSSVEPRAVVGRKSLGATGYVTTMIGSGEHAGKLAIERKGALEGNLLDLARDSDFGEALQAATKLKPREVAFHKHSWQHDGGGENEDVISALTYFAPWDWVIVGTVPSADFSAPQVKADGAIARLTTTSTVAGVGVIAIVALFAWLIGSRIARPISAVTTIAERIAAGDIAAAEAALGETVSRAEGEPGDSRGEDETRQLEGAVLKMTRSLNSLIGQVKLASVQLMSTANQITATVRQQEATVTEFRASTNDVVTATREISVTAQALEDTVQEVAAVTGENAVVAGEGKADLEQMRASMGVLASTSSNVATRLRAIDEKAGDIHQIVGTITRVADQTNLLSLNAAIEAEKAGEYGTGFSVVAREIRRLADQTAVATLDIESMVAEMQAAVNAGVGEMSRFEQLMARSVEDTARLADRLDGIIRRVEALAPRLQMVKEGMHQQAQGAAQISESMLQLNEAARHTAESANEMNNAAGNLNSAVREMQGEVARFTVR